MRKTKIVCTLGPSTDREEVLRGMILAGMNVARFNFSHGTHPEHLARLEKLKALREELDRPVAPSHLSSLPPRRGYRRGGSSQTFSTFAASVNSLANPEMDVIAARSS
mgnify:CR=1 FL=1